MRFRRLFCCLLAVLMLLGCIAVLPADRARALDFTTIEGKLSKWQYYFCRTLMSIALKDSYDAHAETGKNRIHQLYKTKWQMLNPFHKPGGNDTGRIAYCVPRYLFILGAFCFAEIPAIFTFPHFSAVNLYF